MNMSKPAPEDDYTQVSVRVPDDKVAELTALSDLIAEARPGASRTRSDVVRQALLLGIPVLRARLEAEITEQKAR